MNYREYIISAQYGERSNYFMNASSYNNYLILLIQEITLFLSYLWQISTTDVVAYEVLRKPVDIPVSR